jgi:predicted RNA-binding protein with PIN domain
VLLVDGYNLLFAVTAPKRSRLEADRRALVAELERYGARTGQRLRVVFDGGGPRRVPGRHVEVVFVADGSTADDRIVAALEGTADRTKYRVVTSDRAVRKAAEARKFEVTPSGAFWREVQAALAPARADEKPGALTQGEADYWMKEFGIGHGETRGDR